MRVEQMQRGKSKQAWRLAAQLYATYIELANATVPRRPTSVKEMVTKLRNIEDVAEAKSVGFSQVAERAWVSGSIPDENVLLQTIFITLRFDASSELAVTGFERKSLDSKSLNFSCYLG
jgi:hypothetical protein